MKILFPLLICVYSYIGCLATRLSSSISAAATTPLVLPASSPLSATIASAKPLQVYFATVAWKPTTTAKSYKLYYGTSSRHYSAVVTSSSPSAVLRFNYSTLYYFSVTAVISNELESPFSPEGRYVIFLSNKQTQPAPQL